MEWVGILVNGVTDGLVDRYLCGWMIDWFMGRFMGQVVERLEWCVALLSGGLFGLRVDSCG